MSLIDKQRKFPDEYDNGDTYILTEDVRAAVHELIRHIQHARNYKDVSSEDHLRILQEIKIKEIFGEALCEVSA